MHSVAIIYKGCMKNLQKCYPLTVTRRLSILIVNEKPTWTQRNADTGTQVFNNARTRHYLDIDM